MSDTEQKDETLSFLPFSLSLNPHLARLQLRTMGCAALFLRPIAAYRLCFDHNHNCDLLLLPLSDDDDDDNSDEDNDKDSKDLDNYNS